MLYRVDPDAQIEPKKVAPGTLLAEEKYPNIAFKSLKDIIHVFLQQDCGIQGAQPYIAVLALAGIVMNRQCRFTNLDWVVCASELEADLKIWKVELINDFVAQGYGMLTLGEHEVRKLNDATPQTGAPIACIGAGTGLGQCFLVPNSEGEYQCFPSEGAHGEFGPRGEGSDDVQIELLKYLKIKLSGWNRISVERVVSGTGICNIYEFLAYNSPNQVDPKVHRKHMERPRDAGVIAAHAWPGSICEKALKIFAGCYGSQCSTMALYVQPFSGLYITGGVTKKLSEWLMDDGTFLAAYFDKGRLSPLLEKVPLFIVEGDDMGQRGAHLRAVRLLKKEIDVHARLIFDELDVTNRGVLTIKEFEKLGGHKYNVHELVESLDTDKDGKVDFTEFRKGFKLLPSELLAELKTDAECDEEETRMTKSELVAPPFRGIDSDSHANLAEVLMKYQGRSRRINIDAKEDRNTPVFKTRLCKLTKDGDRSKDEDWLERDYWITKAGAICYFSVTEGKPLLYCTQQDLAKATIEEIPVDESSSRQHVFRLQPKLASGESLAATEFGASSKEGMMFWVQQLRALQREAQQGGR